MNRVELTAAQFIEGIAKALHDDFGDSPSTVKIIVDLTGAAPGTVKKWLSKHNGPGGEMLVKLLGISPSVQRFVDNVTRREDRIVRRERDINRAFAIVNGGDGEPSGEIIELIPALQAELFDRRPAAPIQPTGHRDQVLRRTGGAR